ncbi:MAG: hypothetical protein M0C28_33950 [Candidatus Moduliflexus flocculans]|nr:hypothetical protein [Candidatus Moduliflexus flocculans]
MLRPIRWNTFVRDFFVIQIGFLLYGLGLTLLIRADLGISTWLVLEIALADMLGISIGTMTVLMGFVVLGIAMFSREKIGLGDAGEHPEHRSVVEPVPGLDLDPARKFRPADLFVPAGSS